MKDPSPRRALFTSRPFRERHIDRQLLIGRFFGFRSPGLTELRVLELGSGTGAALLAQAEAYPEVFFCGVEIDEAAVAFAEKNRAQCGITNLRFKREDLQNLDRKETYDIILCHGLYSWVRPEVREALLPLIHSILTPTGVAFVSFNAEPGWNPRARLIERLSALDKPNNPIEARILAAREALRTITGGASSAQSDVSEEEKREASFLLQSGDGLFEHELLNPLACAETLAEFVSRARRAGLSYLGDARYYQLCLSEPPRAGDDSLAAIEQRSAGFVRPLHCALVCRRAAEPEPKPLYSLVDDLLVSSPLVYDPAGFDEMLTGQKLFRRPSGTPFPADEEHAQLLHYLCDSWPRPISAAGRVSRDALCELFIAGAVDLHTSTLGIADGIPERPFVSNYARLELSTGDLVTTLRQEYVIFRALEREFMQTVDGKHSLSELSGVVRGWIEQGTITPDKSMNEIQDTRTLTDQLVSELLERARESALLLEW